MLENIIRRDNCGSAMNVLGIPAGGRPTSVLVVVSPAGRELNSARHVDWARPTAYVVREGAVRRVCHGTLTASQAPFNLNLKILIEALADEGFKSYAKGSQPANWHFGEGCFSKDSAPSGYQY
jgi:hypothetical protein